MKGIKIPRNGDHSFNVNVASLLNVTKAILLKDIYNWCIWNKDRNHNIIKGYAFTFNSASALHKHFPYIAQSTISNNLKKLEEDGWLWSTKRFNKKAYDQTKWYTIFVNRYEQATQGVLLSENIVENWKTELVDKIEKCNSKIEKCISDISKSFSKIEKPIPTQTQLKPNSNREGHPHEKTKYKCDVLDDSVVKPNHPTFFEKEKSCVKKEKPNLTTLQQNQTKAKEEGLRLLGDKDWMEVVLGMCEGWDEEKNGKLRVEFSKFHSHYGMNGTYLTNTYSFMLKKFPQWLTRAKHQFVGQQNPKHTIPTQPQNHHQVKALAKKSILGGYDEEGAW